MELFKTLSKGSIDDVKKECEKIGVSILNEDGSYKTIYEVFNELHKVWDNA